MSFHWAAPLVLSLSKDERKPRPDNQAWSSTHGFDRLTMSRTSPVHMPAMGGRR